MISEWTQGYAAAVRDMRTLVASRQPRSPEDVDLLLDDLTQDARVIDHEIQNREQRASLRAKREVQLELLP